MIIRNGDDLKNIPVIGRKVLLFLPDGSHVEAKAVGIREDENGTTILDIRLPDGSEFSMPPHVTRIEVSLPGETVQGDEIPKGVQWN